MTIDETEVKKKYILWIDYGYEGWKPTGFDTLKEALEHEKYTSNWIITNGKLDYQVLENKS